MPPLDPTPPAGPLLENAKTGSKWRTRKGDCASLTLFRNFQGRSVPYFTLDDPEQGFPYNLDGTSIGLGSDYDIVAPWSKD